jgi:Protein of unknown function (DUF3108)
MVSPETLHVSASRLKGSIMRAVDLKARLGVVSLAVCVLAAAPSRATALKVDYRISLAGLPVGSADLAGRFEGSRYNMQVQARLMGLAGLFTGGGKGAATAAGAVASAQPVPASYTVTSRSWSEQRSVRMGLSAGNVVAVDITPPLEERPDRVPVKESHRHGVVDPVSALVMPMLGRGSLVDPAQCNRTIPVFDGAARFDVVLTFAETRTVDKPGYHGPVLVCAARYVPISGHRAGRTVTKFMEDNRDMSVWLAPVEAAHVLVPLRISIKTMVGTSVIEAEHWALDDTKTPNVTRASAPVE